MKMVTKRDGSEQSFDLMKIVKAIQAAREACGDEFDALPIAELVAHEMDDLTVAPDDLPPKSVTIEQIQDLVEEELMRAGYLETAKAFILYRDEHARMRVSRPDPDALSQYIVAAKYARNFEGKLETFEQSVDRVADMHCRKFPHLSMEIRMLFDKFVKTKRVLPSMRSMQFGGPAIEAHNARMFNCSYAVVDRLEFFSRAFYLLLAGCGVGFSVQKIHVNQLPLVEEVSSKSVLHYTVEDDIEGWADALGCLLRAYTSTGEYVEFSYRRIRPEGTPLVTGGGVAPGHLPLKQTLENVRTLLDGALGRRLKPIEILDLMCFVAEGVLAGGIRRSSLICLFDLDDEEMLHAKTPGEFEWGNKNSQRAMANISAVCVRGETTVEEFATIFKAARDYGEPGFYWTENEDYGTNPCGEIGLNPVDWVEPDDEEHEAVLVANGYTSGKNPHGYYALRKTGFAFCNLTEINCAVGDIVESARAAAAIGTLQAAYVDFPYLGMVSEKIAARESLLGVGLTGMADNPNSFDADTLREAAGAAVASNKRWADLIGIPEAHRVTTVKPSGTASLALGGVGSGIHPHHAHRYFRRITANPNEAVAQEFKRVNPHMVEVKPNGDWCLTFPVEGRGTTVKEMPAWEFLTQVLHVYKNWIKPGTAKNSYSPGLTHNVSCTVVVSDHEWESVFLRVWSERANLTAMAFLPRSSDKGFPYMPREEVVDEVDAAKWNKLIGEYKPVDYSDCLANVPTAEAACGGGECQI